MSYRHVAGGGTALDCLGEQGGTQGGVSQGGLVVQGGPEAEEWCVSRRGSVLQLLGSHNQTLSVSSKNASIEQRQAAAEEWSAVCSGSDMTLAQHSAALLHKTGVSAASGLVD